MFLKRILWMILMFNMLVSPFIIIKLREPPKLTDIVESINVNDFYGGLDQVSYGTNHIEFIDVHAYLKELDIREDESDSTESKQKEWAYYDKLKETDFIISPTYYEAPYDLTSKERDLIERVVMHEAGWCPDYRLLILTAQCFRNDCELNGWRPAETFENCGYATMSYANPRAVKAVKDVFDEGIQCIPEKIFCYYNRKLVYSADHEKHRLAIDIDGNRFFY